MNPAVRNLRADLTLMVAIVEAEMAQDPCDPKDVAIAALANLVRLMGAELVAGRHRDDPGLLERAVRAKVEGFTLDGCSPEATRAGVALAMDHAEQALMQVRAQSAAAQSRDLPPSATRSASPAPVLH